MTQVTDDERSFRVLGGPQITVVLGGLVRPARAFLDTRSAAILEPTDPQPSFWTVSSETFDWASRNRSKPASHGSADSSRVEKKTEQSAHQRRAPADAESSLRDQRLPLTRAPATLFTSPD